MRVRRLSNVLKGYERMAKDALERFANNPPVSQYAKKVLAGAEEVRRSIQKGVTEKTATRAFYVGLHTGLLGATIANVFTEADERRGRKVLEAAREGHRLTHGNLLQKTFRSARYRKQVENLYNQRPSLTLTAARKTVARGNRVSYRTILRATTPTESLRLDTRQ